MNVKTIKYEQLKNTGNYEHKKISIEVELLPESDPNLVVAKVVAKLEKWTKESLNGNYHENLKELEKPPLTKKEAWKLIHTSFKEFFSMYDDDDIPPF